MDRFNRRRYALWICLLLGAVTLGCFWPALHNGFVSYDDPDYVTENPAVSHGLTWAGAQWAFGGGHAGNWHPLTWLSHMLDCQLYGLNPAGHHLSNLLFHLVNTLLLFWVLRRMTASKEASVRVAAQEALAQLGADPPP